MAETTPSSPKTHRPFWRRLWQLRGVLLVALVAATLALGYLGFARYFEHCRRVPQDCDAPYAGRAPLDLAYLSLQLFNLGSGPLPVKDNPALQATRFGAPALAAWTAAEALLVLFGEQIQRFLLRFRRNHVVVCGYGRKGRLLVAALREQGEPVVAVDLAADAKLAGHCRARGAVLLAGDARDPGLLRLARVDRARELYCLLGDDGANAQAAMRARALARAARAGRLDCYVHIDDTELVRWLHELEFSQDQPAFRLVLCNLHEIWARDLLNAYPPFALDGGGAVLLVGCGRIGESVLLEIARRRAALPEGTPPLPVTVVDPASTPRLAALCRDGGEVAGGCAVEHLAWPLDGPDFRGGEFLFEAGRLRYRRLYVCLEDDVAGLSAALFLCSAVRGRDAEVVVVQSSEATSLAVLIPGRALPGEAGPRVFPLLERTLRPEVLRLGPLEALARRIHAAYLDDRRRDGASPAADPAMVPWDALPEGLRRSNRAQAEDIHRKLATVGCRIESAHGWRPEPFAFTPDEVERLARLEHDRWVEERLDAGWTYAEKKDVDRRESPYLVPWEALSEPVRDYDRNPVRRIPRLLAEAGLAVRREQRAEDGAAAWDAGMAE